MSVKSYAIAERSSGTRVILNSDQAKQLKIPKGSSLAITIDQQEITLPVFLDNDWPESHVGITWGLPGLPYMDANSIVELKLERDEN